MLSNNPDPLKASQPGTAKAGSAEEPRVLNPWDKIEVASDGNGTVNDSSGRDVKPPFTGDFEAPV